MPPPPCKLGIRFDHTNGMVCALLLGFGLKIAGNLSEDLFFFFALQLTYIFGRKIGLNLSGTISDSDVCSYQIFWNSCPPPPPPPPPFSKSCVRYWGRPVFLSIVPYLLFKNFRGPKFSMIATLSDFKNIVPFNVILLWTWYCVVAN